MSSGRLLELDTAEAITEASGTHPFVAHDLSPTFVAPALHLAGTDTVAWSQEWADGRTGVVVLGDPEDVATLAVDPGFVAHVHAWHPDHVSAPADAYDAVAASLGLRGGNAWDRMATTSPPPAIPAESDVTWFDGDEDELTTFVRAHNPRPHALPGRHAEQRWVVIREASPIVACGCTEPGNTTVPLIGGIAVDQTQRGRGLGAAVTAYLTRDGLDREGACTLGVFADNAHARHLYERLGYAVTLHARTGFPVRH
ncbi:GNAT family N-acetyltransferase [Knoellia subterranea]|uniref:N-acetyltransferase domain-containing protein n=1 Tax=Knoellia subterranea KCTC 19937 TaxID=1385521 RepID=A0A0A0JKD4_9MICO|nr:GNAT family N-acetyltransferase [Knoellia subterranea]KGN36101.1 hypothetical protein N803_09385 [Knoellia subterranea KCTC 19937]